MIITEFTPHLSHIESMPAHGGRVHSISVHPTNSNHIIVANRFGGLWMTEDGGSKWFHLDGLLTMFVRDVAYAPDGKTVIATVERDNRVQNGGGIWVSHNEGKDWKRPTSGDPHNVTTPSLPNISWIHNRISAYGISYAPDDINTVYVGTDYGVAISTDNGDTWSHNMLEVAASGWEGYVFGEKSVISILALPKNKVIALCSTGIYFTEQKFEEGKTWVWNRIRPGNFAFFASDSCKNIDVSPLDDDKVFIIENYWNLLLYEVKNGTFKNIPTTTHCPPPNIHDWDARRGPFVRVSKSLTSDNLIDIWLGSGVSLSKVTCKDINALKKLKADEWINLHSANGLHADSGYLALDNEKRRPILYGCDGGLFKPLNDEGTSWTGITTNSLLINDLGGTNVKSPKHTCLYITTQDNSVWGSGDGGYSWPNHDDSEGFRIQVVKDAMSDSGIRVAFGTTDYPNRFSEAHMKKPKDVPDLDTEGTELVDYDPKGNKVRYLQQAYSIHKGQWFRLGRYLTTNPEFYVSKDNGEKWQRIANISLNNRGPLGVVSWLSRRLGDPRHPKKLSRQPVIYVPFSGTRTNPDKSERIGLIRFTNVFESWGRKVSSERTYDERNLIYIGDKSGSLGVRWTDWDHQAVFGVDPRNPYYIIAPDVYNNKVIVSHDGGVSWKTDDNLTKEVTKNKTLLLQDGHETRVQVTCIAFDPYNGDRIYVGTRDAGVIHSTDAGKTWSTIPNSNKILYITKFFFEPHGDSLIVSSYGTGLWKILTWGATIPFPVDIFCKGSGCNFRWMPMIEPPINTKVPIDWHHKDVIIFLNGKVNGMLLSGSEVKKISVTPGTTFKRYVGKTKDIRDIRIVESEQGEGFKSISAPFSAMENREIIKGIILEENCLIGVISGKAKFKHQKNRKHEKDAVISKRKYEDLENKIIHKFGNKKREPRFSKPYIYIKTNFPSVFPNVLGQDGIINLFAKGFKFYPNKINVVKIMIDSETVHKKFKILQGGTVAAQLKVPQQLPNGKHIVKMIQEIDGKSIEAIESFVKLTMEELYENMQ